MNSKKHTIFLGTIFGTLLMIISFTVSAQNDDSNSGIKTTLKIQQEQNQTLSITGMVENLEKVTKTLRYELSVTVSDESNNSSKNMQSGYFTLEPFESQNLSQTSVSTNSNSQSIILLSIFKEETLLKKIKKVVPKN